MKIRQITKNYLLGISNFLNNIGISLRDLTSITYLPLYILQLIKYYQLGGIVTNIYPIFSDYKKNAGSVGGHYFHQDLLVASYIHKKNPERHVDIGSRIDGFITHLACFRSVDVIDVRKLPPTGHPNITFIQLDLSNPIEIQEATTDSISSLHAIEHFGLGRYGDKLDPNGYKVGFNNILKMLKPGGNLYISFPISNENRVFFNAHRTFQPLDIFSWATNINQIELERFDYIDDQGSLHRNVDLMTTTINISFGCGIYTFKKLY